MALSTDPECYPIEPGILPLVFEMKKSRIFDPCWSCEGHLAADGSLRKSPRLWFYCKSMIYLRLLVDGLNNLRQTAKLNFQWEVVVTFSDPDNPETTFSLQPILSQNCTTSLSALHGDVGEIARSLDMMMTERASALRLASI
jgi:hypothetical protein